tara:strand:+ start:61 stop:1341 length:1281 start_codon:yes stop_codon:yes gene_type:complete
MLTFIIKIILLISFLFSQNQNFQNFEITTENGFYSSPMFIHLSSFSGHYMVIIDEELRVPWYISSGPLGFDFKVNQDRISFFDKGDPDQWIIMDENMSHVDTLTCTNEQEPDYHDIQILSDGGYILQSYDSTFFDMSTLIDGGFPNTLILGLLIQEFDVSKNLIFEWKAWDRLNIVDYTNIDLTDEVIRWMHGNSIEVDYDQNLLISNRLSSEVIKIDRQTGETIWHMGGPLNEFTFINDPYGGFQKQHDVRRLDNGNITLYDNGNTHLIPLSRALEYSINENEKTAELVWSFSHPENLVGVSMGSVQRLSNNNTLISWGNVTGRGAIITEVDIQGNIVLEIEFPFGYSNYKVRKNDWDFNSNLIIGDINQDNSVDIFDLFYVIDYGDLENDHHSVFHLFYYDLNRDNDINLEDVFSVSSAILYDD